MTEKRYRLLLFAIFLLAVLTRFFGIASDSLWLDEGLSIRLASLPFWEVFREAAPVDHNPPLYLYLLHFWIKLFGNSEAATRSLAALLNLATFPVIVAILQRLTSREATLLALLIFVLSPFQIYYAQETRAYSLLNFLSATSLLCFLQLLKSPKPAMQILYVFSSALLLYSHIYGAFILLFENLWWVYLQIAGKDSPTFPRWLLWQGIIALIFSPYLLHLLPLVLRIQGGYWINPLQPKHFIATFIQFGGSIPLGIALSILALFGMWRALSEKAVRDNAAFLSGWMLTPILVPFGLSLLLTPFYLIRYPIAAAIPFYALAAGGIKSLPKYWRQGMLALLALLAAHALFQYYSSDTRAPWRQVAADLSKTDPAATVLLGADFCRDVFTYYGMDNPQTLLTVSRRVDPAMPLTTAQLTAIRTGGSTLFFVASHFGEMEEKLLIYLEGHFRLVSRREYPHWDLFGRQQVFIRVYTFEKALQTTY